MSDDLQHYGVKGMRWGVRRSEKQLSKGKKSTDNDLTIKVNGQTYKVKNGNSSPNKKNYLNKLKQLETKMNETKDPKKLKALEKEYGKIEDSIDYRKKTPKKERSNSIASIKERGRADKEVSKKLKSGKMTRKEAKEQRWQNFHNQYSKNSIYKKGYERRISQGQDPKKAMRGAYKELRMIQNLTVSVTDAGFKAATALGREALSKRG